jgi:hypothetical protein
MRALALLTIFLIAGCGDHSRPKNETFVVSDSAGVQIVESFSPAWGPAGRRIDAQPVVRIGREEEGPYQFGLLFSGRLLENGALAIPVPQAQEVRIFDSTGTHVRSIGGQGEGPGEFQSLFQVFRFPGDSLAGFDRRLGRTTVISTSTGGHRSFPTTPDGNFDLFGVVGDGQCLMYSPGGAYHPELPPGLQWVPTEVLSVEPSNGSSRVIRTLPGRQQFIEPDGNTRQVIPALYSIQAAADEGFYWGTPDRYEIGFYDANGRLRRMLRRRTEPVPVAPDMIQAWIDSQLEWVERTQGERAVPRYRRTYEEAHFQDFMPHFEWAFVDRDHRLWVGAHSWPSDQAIPRVWSVFSPEGVWLGDLDAPEGVRIVDAEGDRVLGIWMDQLEVPYVQLHRMTAGSR